MTSNDPWRLEWIMPKRTLKKVPKIAQTSDSVATLRTVRKRTSVTDRQIGTDVPQPEMGYFQRGQATERESALGMGNYLLRLGNNAANWRKVARQLSVEFPANTMSADWWNPIKHRIEEHKNFKNNSWGITPTSRELLSALYCRDRGIEFVFVLNDFVSRTQYVLTLTDLYPELAQVTHEAFKQHVDWLQSVLRDHAGNAPYAQFAHFRKDRAHLISIARESNRL
jgi:hypothetical protein